MDILECLLRIQDSVRTQLWTQEQYLVLVDTLLGVLSRGQVCKAHRRLIVSISKTIGPKLNTATKGRLCATFHRDSGDVLMVLKLYTLLQVEEQLDVLAHLTEAYARSPRFDASQLPDFKLKADTSQLLATTARAGAVFVTHCDPCPELISEYIALALSEKPKTNAYLVPLYRDMIGKVDKELFRTTLFPVLQRLIIRSANNLEAVANTIEMLKVDLSDCAKDLIFPIILEHFDKPGTAAGVLTLLSKVAVKAKDHSELVSAFLTSKGDTEPRVRGLVCSLAQFQPSPSYNDQIVDFCIERSHRLRTEDGRKELIGCIARFATRLTQRLVGFFEKEGPKAVIANLYVRLGGSQLWTYTAGWSSMQYAVMMSAGLPSPCPQSLRSLLADPNSSFSSLVPANVEESLALSRLWLTALKLFPTSPVLRKRLAKSLLQDNTSRDFIIPLWPGDIPVAEVCATLLECIESQECLQAFRHNYRRITKFLVDKCANEEDRAGVLRLFMSKRIAGDSDSHRALHFFVTKHGLMVKAVPLPTVCESVYSVALYITLGGYSSFSWIAESALFPSLFARIDQLARDVEREVQDPEFMEILRLDALVQRVARERGIVLTATREADRISELLRAVYNRAVATSLFMLKAYQTCTSLMPIISNETLKDELLSAALFQCVNMVAVPELADDIFSTASCILRTSTLFAPIHLDLVKLLLSLQRSTWREKLAKHIIAYINERVSLDHITEIEAVIFTRVFEAAIYQKNTNLRASAIDILARLVYERKIMEWDRVLQLVVYLLRTYSERMYSDLFAALRQTMDPLHWQPLLTIAVFLPSPSQQLLLQNLLQYEVGLPSRTWSEVPLWMLMNDELEETADLALMIWHKFRLSLSRESVLEALPLYLSDENEETQALAARSLATVWTLFPDLNRPLFAALVGAFRRRSGNRSGFPRLFQLLVPVLASYSVEILQMTISEEGYSGASSLRQEMLDLGVSMVKVHGKKLTPDYFQVLQSALKSEGGDGKLAAVLLLGHLAQFFPQEDGMVDVTIDSLLKALASGHEALYHPISECLPRLISYRKRESQSYRAVGRKLFDRYFLSLFSPLPLSEKRGVAYSFACILKGLGVEMYDRLRVKSRIEEIVAKRQSNSEDRGSVLLAIEGITAVLRTSFESYLTDLVPFVLECFSDPALFPQAQLTIKSLIASLSTSGVRKVLPVLTRGLEDAKWKSQVSAIQALGKMAFCAPKRLSEILPHVVPQVLKAFSSTNLEVTQAAFRALEDIGSVVTTPEVSQHLRVLLKALTDASALKEGLAVLLETQFTHCIDAPALSLLYPIVEGALKSRISEVKKMGAQAAGGFLTLVSSTHFEPYIDRAILAIRNALFDSIPEVRNVAAQNLGLLCRALGPQRSQEVLSMLEAVFLSEGSSQIEKSGAVHAYSEVALHQPSSHWDSFLPRLIARAEDPNPNVRLFSLGLLLFLLKSPRFPPYMDSVLPAIQQNLTHSQENVRTLSVRLMQLIIKAYSHLYLDRILPQLESELFSASFKTRLGAVTLVGEVMEIVDAMDRRQGRKESTIPMQQRHRILAAIYILRSDRNASVSNQASKFWKSLVENTPKMVPTITCDVVDHILNLTESRDSECGDIATTTIQRMLLQDEEEILSDWIAYFHRQLPVHAKSVATVLSVICTHATKKEIGGVVNALAGVLQRLLAEEEEATLIAAGSAFATLIDKLSPDAVARDFLSSIVSSVTERPRAFRELLRQRNAIALKSIVPSVMKCQKRAAILTEIAGFAASEILGSILECKSLFPAILKEAVESPEMLSAVSSIVLHIRDAADLQRCIDALLLVDLGPRIVPIFHKFLTRNSLDLTPHVSRLLELLLPAVHFPEVADIIGPTIAAVVEPVQKEEMHKILSIITRELAESRGEFPCFQSESGLQPFLHILHWSMVLGPAEAREPSVRAYSELISLTDATVLKKVQRKVTGALLRLACEEIPFSTREALLSVFHALIRKVGDSLLPFLPQLRSVLVQSLQSDRFHLRRSALKLLPDYIPLDPRPEVLILDLSSLKGPTDTSISCLKAISEVAKRCNIPRTAALKSVGKLMGTVENESNEKVAEAVGEAITKMIGDVKSVVESVEIAPRRMVALGYYLRETDEDGVKLAAALYSKALVSCPSETIKSLTIVSQSHPKAAFQLCLSHFPLLLSNISRSVSELLCNLPPEEFTKDPERISALISVLARVPKAGRTPELDDIVTHIFALKSGKGAREALKVLYLLPTHLQQEFREYVYALAA